MLDFVYDFAMERKNHRKNPIQIQLYICVYRYYLQLVKEFGHNNFKVRDWSIFVEKFLGDGKTGYDSLTRKPPITAYAKKNVGKEKDITRSKQFQIYAGHFDNQNDINLSMEWLNHVIPTSEELGIIELDKKRSFSAKQTDELFADQGEICDVTGKKIPRSDAVAAHVIAHSKGGKTNRKNIVITGSSENRDMGTMSPEEYKLFQKFKKDRKNVEKLFTNS
jgi:5-methylcytosine-specific restriction endonuclease McrA